MTIPSPPPPSSTQSPAVVIVALAANTVCARKSFVCVLDISPFAQTLLVALGMRTVRAMAMFIQFLLIQCFLCHWSSVAALNKNRVLSEIVLSVESTASTSVNRYFHGLLPYHGSNCRVFGRLRIANCGIDELNIRCRRLTFHGGIFHDVDIRMRLGKKNILGFILCDFSWLRSIMYLGPVSRTRRSYSPHSQQPFRIRYSRLSWFLHKHRYFED
jgi:hypothetical protein